MKKKKSPKIEPLLPLTAHEVYENLGRRGDRLVRFIALDAPSVIIADEFKMVVDGLRKYRLLSALERAAKLRTKVKK